MLRFCEVDSRFQFPDASLLAMRTRSNRDGKYITEGTLHYHALRSILLEPPQWSQSFGAIVDATLKEKDALVISFGSERCVPPSLLNEIGHQVIHFADDESLRSKGTNSMKPRTIDLNNDIAVVGMSCKVSGANNLEEFWDLLCAAKSQHKEVPKERFGFESTFRDDDQKRKWFANLVAGYDMFDHKFFKKSPRESASMDPQQRHILQVAYQAVEQSGYFQAANPDKKIGCYVGVCISDYEENIACHSANAFMATGNLKSFIAGKVSHYFGWTGPGQVIDTACSSSAVAVHQACRSIISGECNAAVAGGTHFMSSPIWFQNLAGGSFLSPTGQCKPFDSKADGYCRGEGAGAVFLKKLSTAIADGDQILGIVAATGVQQNENCTPIFVPNTPSLSNLFRNVTAKAQIKPSQISVVEAHGTGTPVGDPAEYDSVRQALGGNNRNTPLMLSSVKGLVGHMECTSGIISMIKMLLMIQKGQIPAQASFATINPAIHATATDHINIPTSLQPWDVNFRAALINNYGASGSNASMVLTQPPVAHPKAIANSQKNASSDLDYPFWFSGFNDQSISRYLKAFRTFLSRTSSSEASSLANISFNLARQSNRTLEQSLIFSARSISDLEDKIAGFDKGSIKSSPRPATKPVVFCFGGQVSTFVGLDKNLYNRVAVLRKHLNEVDAIVCSTGAGSIFPGIFERTPFQDTVRLQTILFANQYACARSWIDSGVTPSALVGHSFGELTALCISGALSLEDSLKMIVSRSTLIRDDWGSEKGAMMVVEGDLNIIEDLLTEATKSSTSHVPATIACYNGPRSFTLAGSTAGVDAVGETIAKSDKYSKIRNKRLNVSNAFHCALVDGITQRLEQSARGLKFREPKILFERATEYPSNGRLTSQFVADHMRFPVYFHHAVTRVAKQFPSSIFLEIGSNSGITNMASRALGDPSDSTFQALNVTSDNAWNSLLTSTINLWKAGLNTHHWAHQGAQTKEHTAMLLPPYQFEESRHWMELKTRPAVAAAPTEQKSEPEVQKLPDTLFTFVGYQDHDKRVGKFRINTMIPKYDKLIEGHVFVHTAPICPATVQLDLVIESLRHIRPDLRASKFEPQIHGVENQSPICVDPSKSTWIEVEDLSDKGVVKWKFQVFSTSSPNDPSKSMHTTGEILFRSTEDIAFRLEFARFERLISHQRCVDLLNSNDVEDIIQGRNIYKMFAEIVDYGGQYRGLQKLVGRGGESAGLVRKAYDSATWFDALLVDNFAQIGGIWINCMTDREPTDMFICNGIEQWVRSPKLLQEDPRPSAYHCFANNHRPSDKQCLTDVFVFSADTGELVEVILGISYVRVPKATMSKVLLRFTASDAQTSSIKAPAPSVAVNAAPVEPIAVVAPSVLPTVQDKAKTKPAQSKPKKQKPKDNVVPRLKEIIAELSGIEQEEIKEDSELADLGIDSLMGMEMAKEVEGAFNISIPDDDLMQITTFPELTKCVRSLTGSGAGADEEGAEDDESEGSEDTETKSSNSSSPDLETPVTPPETGTTSPFDDLKLAPDTVNEAFLETKRQSDQVIAECGLIDYVKTVIPIQNQYCIAAFIEALDKLGVSPGNVQAGEEVSRVSHPKEIAKLVDYFYGILEEAKLIEIQGKKITRTDAPLPSQTSEEIYHELMTQFPEKKVENELAHYVGAKMADVLNGTTDGIKLIFSNPEGKQLCSDLYAYWPMNQFLYKQMEDFLRRLVSKIGTSEKPFKVLEMGAGTGGVTKWLVPLLASLKIPVEYTFTDLGSSFIAAGRKNFKQYPFMKFKVVDIEKTPTDDLIGSQHFILACNAVHATHNLVQSTSNIRKILRSDGFLMLLEMTTPVYWVDLVFGLFEGWWFFEDGRTHAVSSEKRWEKDLRSAGFEHVDWTDGDRPENTIEKLLIAMASAPRYENAQLPSPPLKALKPRSADCELRKVVVDDYVRKMTEGFTENLQNSKQASRPKTYPQGDCVLVTGGTGSLGCHIVESAALLPGVTRVICLNRRSKQDAKERQQQAFTKRGVFLPAAAAEKLTVIETDMSKPQMGMNDHDYEFLINNVTHIIHNAWLMNSKWPIKQFEPQFRIMRNMISLASSISTTRPSGTKVTFQFISSIATIGHWPLWTGNPLVPEERMTIDSVLPTGYGDAKYVCELMLDATLHAHPDRFRTMAVRLGQIAGSSTSGYWNPMEHLTFLWKSSQTLKVLPDFDGPCSWTPADHIAATLVDLITLPEDTEPYPIYHIDNPVRQPWKHMIRTLADALDVPQSGIIPYADWIQRVRDYQPVSENTADGLNPAFLLIDFLDENFLRMSCGGLLMDTKKCCEHSRTLAREGPVSDDVARLYVRGWRDMGFLK